jgi:N-acetylglucosamine kinase-like BadF-type ATPase
LLGDEGSAYWIARRGLMAAVRAADGRIPLTSLLLRFQNELGARAPQDLIDVIYSPQMTRERLAGLAYLVFDSAQRDDQARQIVADAAHELSTMIAVVRRQLQLAARQYVLALAGSVVLHESGLQGLIFNGLSDAPPERVVEVTEPVRGAVALARILAKSSDCDG